VRQLNDILGSVSRLDYFGSAPRTYWNEQIRNFSLIALPSLAVLPTTSVGIPVGAVDDHNHEKDEIEPREWAPARGF
jgi:hypothetical protein